MAKNAVELLLKLKGDTKGLKGTNNALKNIGKELDGVESSAEKASKSIANIGVKGAKGVAAFSVAATAAASAVGALVYKVNQMNVELRRNTELSGTSIETFQQFAQMGEQAGVSVESTADALNNLNLKITEWASVASGSGGDVLKKLGLDSTELSKVQDSGEQMIVFLDKLGKSSKNIQRFFADELGSDALIFLAGAAKEAGNLDEAFKKIQDTGSIITQEESDQLLEYNKKMVELKGLIAKVGAQAVISFDTELKGALNSASNAMQKLIKDFQDPFGETAKAVSYLDGTLDTLIGGLKLAKDGVDLLLYSGDTSGFGFTKNLDEANESLKQFGDGIKATIYSDYALAEKEIERLSGLIGDFDVGALLEQGFDETKIKAEWQKVAKISLENVTEMQDAVKKYPPQVQEAMRRLLNKMIEDVKKTNAIVSEEISSIDIKVDPNIDEQEMAQDIINKSDIAIRTAQSQIEFIEIQFKAGTIDLSDYKKQVSEQVELQNKALKDAADNAVGIDQLSYKKRLEQNKIYSKKIVAQQAIVSKESQDKIKANDEIAQQEVELLNNKGKYIEALKAQEKIEIDQLNRRKDLSDLDKTVQAINISELYDFKEAEVEAERVTKKIELLLSKLSETEGAEQVSILGDLDVEIKKLQNLETAYGGLDKNVKSFVKERNEITQKTLKTEEDIKAAADLVIQSKIQVLQAQGKVNEAASLQLSMKVAEINASKDLTTEQKVQLAQDAIAISNLSKRAQETQNVANYNAQITKNMMDLYRAQGDVNKASELELKLQIEKINANKNYTGEMKEQLASDAIKLANLERQSKLEDDIKYNVDLLSQKELELLNVQGNKEASLQKQFEMTEKQIQANERLDSVTRAQVLEIERQKLAYGEARLEVEAIEAQISQTMALMQTAGTAEEFKKLADSIQPSIDKLTELESKFPGLATKSQEFTDQSIKGLESYSLSIEQASNLFADNFVDTFAQVINGTKSVEDAFKGMLANIVQEMLKSNISSMMQGLFGGGGAAAGGAGMFTDFMGLFSGAALHTGGIAGQDGFARNAPINFGNMLPKYHTGGIAGQKPNEVPAMLEIGEEVLTRKDPRHRDNGGNASSQVNIINEMNTEETAKELGSTRSFQKAIRNEIRTNPSEYKSYLG